MKRPIIFLSILFFAGCGKESNEVIKPPNKYLIASVPYAENEQVIFESGTGVSITTLVKKQIDEIHFSPCAGGCTDTVGQDITYKLVSAEWANEYVAKVNFSSIHDDVIFLSIYPSSYPNTTGNSTYFTIDLSNGAFVCDGVFTVCYEDLVLNNNTFKDVISVDTRASDNSSFIQVTKIYFSKEYGIAGYVLNNGAVFSRKL